MDGAELRVWGKFLTGQEGLKSWSKVGRTASLFS